MDRLLNDEDVFVAPAEVRELLSRLTEQSVEAIPANEPRTLAGLSLETGVSVEKLREALDKIRGRRNFHPAWIVSPLMVAIVGVGWYALQSSHPAPIVPRNEAPPAVIVQNTPSMQGLVPLSSVTYGPDAGTAMVDPTFHPSVDLPPGISLTAGTANILWGAGDARAATINLPLTRAEQQNLQTVCEELLKYASKGAASRGAVPIGPLKVIVLNLQFQTYHGSGSLSVNMPRATGDNSDEIAGAAREGARHLIDMMQQQFKFEEMAQRQNGP